MRDGGTMAAFLENLKPFMGNGKENEDGLSLEKYLEGYDPYRWETPSVTTDIIVYKYDGSLYNIDNGLKLLMVKRKNHPCIGEMALPGGFVNIREDVHQAAKRELFEETGLTDLPIEQIRTWGDADRDPRSRIITVAYMALLDSESAKKVVAGDDAEEAFFVNVSLKLRGRGEQNGKVIEFYEVNLTNVEHNVNIHGSVEHRYNSTGYLREDKYEVMSTKGIAFDHARFIVQSLLLLKERIKLNHYK